MYLNLFFALPLGFLFIFHAEIGALEFTLNGFNSSDVTLDGVASITGNGLLMLTNLTNLAQGHAFHPNPIPFKPTKNGSVLSFSTTFVFGIVPNHTESGFGLVFVIAPTRGFQYSLPRGYLGMFNLTNVGDSSNHVVGVEMDTIKDPEFKDINSNHVGIDINGLDSVKSAPASYFTAANSYENISLSSWESFQVWVEYDGSEKIMNVTIAPITIPRPAIPLLTLPQDLSSILLDSMYVGFSSSTGALVASHYIRGWSFSLNGTAPLLDIRNLPPLPPVTPTQPPPPVQAPSQRKQDNKPLKIALSAMSALVVFIIAISFWIFYGIQRKRRFSEEFEDWESEYGPHRFRYKDLYVATNGFPDEEVLGEGGFGKVYKGTLRGSNTEVAVKKVAHDARQGMKSFVAEIVSLGQLSHRNLVQLLGYCRRKGELLLVYEYMPNGSLDKFLYSTDASELNLTWSQRFNIIKGVASGLLYLHEEYGQVVVHRDIKASNVLLDSEMNGRLSDFGLARLHERGGDPRTTHVMGTLGYLAPENPRTGKATPCTDVYAFGAFLLEVVCGRRPVDLLAPVGEAMLVDMVFGCWKRGVVLVAVDRRLKGEYVEEEAEMVLKLGLLCLNLDPDERPTIKHAMAYLEKVVAMPDLRGMEMGPSGVSFSWKHLRAAMDNLPVSYSSSFNIMYTRSGSMTESQLSQGR